MKNKSLPVIFLLWFTCLICSCNTATPENYFEASVLGCNMMTEFAGQGLYRELDQPSAILLEGTTDQTRPMKRKEVMDQKLEIIEEHFDKVKKLKETTDTKEMVQASIELHEFVLPVYRNEYQQLAKLYDDGASKEITQLFTQGIHDKYAARFEELFDKLTAAGKSYAERHKINVQWGIQSSPQGL